RRPGPRPVHRPPRPRGARRPPRGRVLRPARHGPARLPVAGVRCGGERAIRVLVVDDHPLFRMGLSLALTAAGFEVVGEAGDGEQAVQLAAAGAADLVVMDVRMPGLDGIEACARLTGRPDGPVVVMLTTHDEPGVVRAARPAGARALH